MMRNTVLGTLGILVLIALIWAIGHATGSSSPVQPGRVPIPPSFTPPSAVPEDTGVHFVSSRAELPEGATEIHRAVDMNNVYLTFESNGDLYYLTEPNNPCGDLSPEQCEAAKTAAAAKTVNVIDSPYNGMAVSFKSFVVPGGSLVGTVKMTLADGSEVSVDNVYLVMSDFATNQESIVGELIDQSTDGALLIEGSVNGTFELVTDGGEGYIVNIKTTP